MAASVTTAMNAAGTAAEREPTHPNRTATSAGRAITSRQAGEPSPGTLRR